MSSRALPEPAPSVHLTVEDIDTLRRALMRIVRRLREERSSDDISDTQYQTLAALQHHGPLSPTALAELQRIQPPPMTRVVNALADAGFVTRTPHPTDGRQVVVTLTTAGEAHVVETRLRRNAWLAARLDALAPDDVATLARAAELIEGIAAR